MATNIRDHHMIQVSLHEEWMQLQGEEFSELRQAAQQFAEGNITEVHLTQLIEKIINHFQDLMEKRRGMFRSDMTSFLTSSWCNSLENSASWIGGFRPSSSIRLVYALSGQDIESNFEEFLQGKKVGNLGDLSSTQMRRIDELQRKIIQAEDKLSSRLASFQDDMFDQPLLGIMKVTEGGTHDFHSSSLEGNKVIDDNHGRAMATLMEEVDQLRMKSIVEIVEILTPAQAVEFLAAKTKVRVCMHEWGKKRDADHGRN